MGTIKNIQDIVGKATDSKVITEMSDDELKKFEEDWKLYWIPSITDEQIESGEFETELNELELKESDEKLSLKETEKKELQMESLQRLSESKDVSSKNDEEPNVVQAQEVDICSTDEFLLDKHKVAEDSPVENFVKKHPLKVFYFGLAMLIIAILVFQCCFLPEYPPCSWFKCILECIEKASLGEL